jgi:SpoVK/Ycf46/Vps4 family AAA+-type ATPase
VLDEIVEEHQAVERLRAAGLEPSRTLLLTGAPGVGKTMTARYIAAATGLPLVTLDLAGVMSSLLGQSALNLRRAFEIAGESPCVFFVDEVDALAKRRNDASDVGELKRLVNVLLLALEQRPATGMLIAATNHAELLDPAIWRRFERVLRLPTPGFQTRRRIVEDAVATYGQSLSAEELDWCAAATQGRTGAHLHRLVRAAVRRVVLHGTHASMGRDLVEDATRDLVRAAQTDERARVAFCHVATVRLGLSQREVARRLGVSHVQVGRWLRHQPVTAPGDTQAQTPTSRPPISETEW